MFNIARILKPAPENWSRAFSIEPHFFAIARSEAKKQSDRRRTIQKNLTRRANHRHAFIIARILEPAPGNRSRAFSIEPRFSPSRGAKRRSNPIVVERFGKNLTRRANHRHMFNIARILEPAPGNRSRAFSIGRQPHSRRTILPCQRNAARRVCK
jgi:hypothetical protein